MERLDCIEEEWRYKVVLSTFFQLSSRSFEYKILVSTQIGKYTSMKLISSYVTDIPPHQHIDLKTLESTTKRNSTNNWRNLKRKCYPPCDPKFWVIISPCSVTLNFPLMVLGGCARTARYRAGLPPRPTVPPFPRKNGKSSGEIWCWTYFLSRKRRNGRPWWQSCSVPSCPCTSS